MGIVPLCLFNCLPLHAQESHYHRGLRSQDTDYGLVVEPPVSGVGMFWSRTRDIDDVKVVHETAADSIRRRKDFMRLCREAYDAYDVGDAYHTVLYGDSALNCRYHTPDLYFFMAVSFEKLGAYEDADWAYKKAVKAGYVIAPKAYEAFKQRQLERKAAEKLQKQEEKRKKRLLKKQQSKN